MEDKWLKMERPTRQGLPSLGTDEAMQLERRSRDRRNTTQQKRTTCGGSMWTEKREFKIARMFNLEEQRAKDMTSIWESVLRNDTGDHRSLTHSTCVEHQL